MILIASSMNVQTMRKRPAAGMYLQQASRRVSKISPLQPQGPALWQYVTPSWPTFPQDYSLFYRVRGSIQPLLDLVCLLPELFQWTWVIRCVCSARSPKSIVLRTEVITRRAPYLSHGRCSCKGKLLLANVSGVLTAGTWCKQLLTKEGKQ